MKKNTISKTTGAPYYIGLDIGTNSVGWAVTDENYNLCKFKKKDMWGIRLFENAKTAEERRLYRTNRRRIQRQHQRIDLLQELFAEEMAKVDDTFFLRLNESRLHLSDKSTLFKHPIFNDDAYSDIEYHKEYPTIYHLRKALIENKKESYDIRLVYLALHHIIKNRGHFLVDGDLRASKSFDNTFEAFCNALRASALEDFDVKDQREFEYLIRTRELPKKNREKSMEGLFLLNEEDKSQEQIAFQKKAVKEICKLLVGNKGDISKIVFNEDLADLEKTSFKFSEPTSEEIRNNLDGAHVEAANVYDVIKALYDWSILVDILANEDYISSAKVNEYDRHKMNLAIVKSLMRKYCNHDVYNNFFNSEEEKANYVNYIGYVKKNGRKYNSIETKCTDEDFYKELGVILKGFEPDVTKDDLSKYEKTLRDVEQMNLLPLQRSKNNSVVPRQVHEAELIAIINNARKYLPFLIEEDEGITVADKIVSIFEFRVPYYVGPLSDKYGKNSWIVRKRQGRILPWNFSEYVDEEASNNAFIRRMTNKCTYLVNEDVLPKNSILYSKYMVLNELNNLKIRGEKLSIEQKQDIFQELFMTKTRVTGKQLLTYLNSKYDPDLEAKDLSGFDIDFKANMRSYLDFSKSIYGETLTEEKIGIAENIIRWITIYDNDAKMIRKIIEKEYPEEFDNTQLKKVCRLKYNGWGRLSERLLDGIEGVDCATGEQLTIIGGLWRTNYNLMQLLSNQYTFSSEIEKENAISAGEVGAISFENIVEPLYVSPANKRAIWQTLQIVNELIKIKGYEPKKIFVEMARSDEEKGDKGRKDSRKKRLIELYENCKDDVRNWCDEIKAIEERKLSSKKLYLYYTQMGKCMYTGENIDIDDLMVNNSKWDIDHIFPQSKIMDDSLDNLVLVSKVVNEEKGNNVLSTNIQKKMSSFWSQLLSDGFISKKKYEKLTKRGGFSEEELSGFIARQLVETRQSSKVVAQLLGQLYESTKVVYVKANLVSRFRNRELVEQKCRRINDYHHAKDAYLNIVVGNVYNAKYTSDPIRWMKKNRDSNYSINATFNRNVEINGQSIWVAPEYDSTTKIMRRNEKGGLIGGSIDIVRATMRKNTVLYTEYSYCEKGELFNAQPKSFEENAKIPLKAGLDVKKYGGYKSPNTSYFSLVEFDGRNQSRIKQIIGVPIYIANIIDHKPDAFLVYCEKEKGLKNVDVLCEKMKKNALISVNGFPMRLRGENENQNLLKGNMQLILDDESTETIRRIEKYVEMRKGKPVNPKYDGFDNEKLNIVYNRLLEKLSMTYSKRPANQANILKKGEDLFRQLDLGNKAIVINEIITMLRCDITTKANLAMIGGSSNAGNFAINKNTMGTSSIVLINQSITGLLENRRKLS